MEKSLLYIYAILLPGLPLLGSVINGLFGKKLSEKSSGWFSSLMVFISFCISLSLFFSNNNEAWTVNIGHWFSVGQWDINFAFLFDSLSILMILIITGVGFLIHVYSIGYMHGDKDFNRFFSYLNLFIFFMLILVLANSYLIMFIGWEGVGLCSYLLIGFWYKNTSFNLAGKKAFVMNRIGDIGFVIAMFYILSIFGTLEFEQLKTIVPSSAVNTGVLTIITLLLFFAATGKSAQLPLFTWLPDAMAGPTPVSALIHAATMVTAGIYMITRSSVLFLLTPFTMEVILVIGTATCLLAALIGMKQNDIKKVLAYSTVSQLGILFAAIGVGAFSSAFFHLTTHAFFKALLFLAAGSIIHALHGEQDIRKMGGLKPHIKITYITFLIGTLAISGIFPFSGFFSKDEILAHVFIENKAAWFVLQASSYMTVFYMFRVVYLVFFGEFRGIEETKKHIHESPSVITVPLIILAVLATIAGFMGLPAIFNAPHLFNDYLNNAIVSGNSPHLEHATEWMLMGIALAGAIAVWVFAKFYYVNKGNLPEAEGEKLSPFAALLSNKFYVDEIYDFLIKKPINFLSVKFYTFIDKALIDKTLNGSGKISLLAGKTLRITQDGRIGYYVFAMLIGIISLMIIQIIK